MMQSRAQVATEYLLITGFVLVIVTIIFTYSYISNNQAIKTSQANSALDKMINAADLVYALGPGNVEYVWVSFPRDLQGIQDITVCENTGFQGHNEDCSSQGGVKAGAIEMQLSLLGGVSSIARPARAEIELDDEAGGCPAGGTGCCSGTSCLGYKEDPSEAIREGRQRFRVEWCDSENSDKICIKRG